MFLAHSIGQICTFFFPPDTVSKTADTLTEPGTTELGTTKPGTTEPGTTISECDQAKKSTTKYGYRHEI
jgi:hypothetical protein